MRGIVTDIQRFCLHDGPGIRTMVFLKGCPLRCRWCCNPETQNPKPEWMTDAANPGGKRLCGREMTAEEVLDAAARDEIFYRHGGGLTVSGGEPLQQSEFLFALLRGARERALHTALETCGHGDYALLREAAGLLGYLLYDMKSLDCERHRAWTGQGNALILENFERLCGEFPDLPKCVRTPVVPGCNEDEIKDIRAFALQHANTSFEALPYHRLGEAKYRALGREYPYQPKGIC